jgi:NHL repeat
MRRIRTSTLAAIAALCALAGALALTPAAAQASVVLYPEAPTGTFGEAGAGEGQFSTPTGIAVNEETGDVYVLDSNNSRVEQFSAEGKYLSQFSVPRPNYNSEGDIAIDNSSDSTKGDIYVTNNPGSEHGGLDVYTPTGEHVSHLAVPGRLMEAITVDPKGNLWAISSEGEIYEYSDTGSLLREFPDGFEEAGEGLAVDTDGNVYKPRGLKGVKYNATGQLVGVFVAIVGEDFVKGMAINSFVAPNDVVVIKENRIEEYGPFGEPFEQPERVFGTQGNTIPGGVAVNNTTGVIYVSEENANRIDVFKPIIVNPPAVDDEPPTVSAVTRTSALLSGTVNPENNPTTCDFEYVAASEYEPGAPNPYANGGSTPVAALTPGVVDQGVGPAVITGLSAGTTYDYRLAAGNEAGVSYGPNHTFTTAPPTPPVASTGAAGEVTQTTATLTGTVDPEGMQTSYEFEVGTDTSYGGAKLFGNAGVSARSEAVSIALQFLIPGMTYHYRLVATNEDGTSYGQDVTFTTPGIPALISQPPAVAQIPSPSVQFPSVAGAITKGQGTAKGSKKKAQKRSKHKKKHAESKHRKK